MKTSQTKSLVKPDAFVNEIRIFMEYLIDGKVFVKLTVCYGQLY